MHHFWPADQSQIYRTVARLTEQGYYEQVPEIIAPYRQEIDSPREHFFWLLTLENGIRNMRAKLEWVESVIERIKNGQVSAK